MNAPNYGIDWLDFDKHKSMTQLDIYKSLEKYVPQYGQLGLGNSMSKLVSDGALLSASDVQAAALQQQLSLDTYNQTQSFQAQVDQMKQAGLNPALMYGSSAPSSGGADAPSVGNSGTNISSRTEKLSALFQNMASIASTVMQAVMGKAQIAEINARTEGQEINNRYLAERNQSEIDLLKSNKAVNDASIELTHASIDEKRMTVEVLAAQREEIWQNIQESNSRITRNEYENILTWVTSLKTQKEFSQLDELLALNKRRTDAQIRLDNSASGYNDALTGKVAHEIAEIDIRQQEILSNIGLIDQKTATEEWNTKGAKRSYKWSPINDTCHNIAQILTSAAISAGSVMKFSK